MCFLRLWFVFLLISSNAFSENNANFGADNVPFNPCFLKPGWWSYFETCPEVLQKRVAEAEIYFNNLKKTEIVSLNPEMSSSISEFLVNIQTLHSLKSQPQVFTNVESLERDDISFNEWYENIKNLRGSEIRLNDFENEQKYDEKTAQNSESDLNDLFIKYLAIDGISNLKMESGLRILVEKSALAIDRHNLQALKSKIEGLKQISAQYKKIINIDPRKINFSSTSLSKINDQISDLEIKLFDVNCDNFNLKLSLSKQLSGESISEIRKDVLKQKLVCQQAIHAQMETQLINLHLIKELVLASQDSTNNQGSLYKKIENWDNRTAEIKKSLTNWSRSSRKELSRAIESLSLKQETIKPYQILLDESKRTLITTQEIQLDQFVSQELIKLSKSLNYFKNRNIMNWVQYQKETIPSHLSKSFAPFERTLFSLGDTPINTYGILKFLIIILFFYLSGIQIKKSILKYGNKQKKIQAAGIYTLSRLAFYFFLIFGILFAFMTTGINLTTFNVVAGALGIGIGFGLQSIFNNFISGILILLEKNIRIGDVIELESGEVGTVIEINVRNTLLQSFDGIDLLIPNSEFITNKISNRTLLNKTRRLHVPFSVSYNTDKNFLKEILLRGVNEVPMTVKEKKKEAQLWLVNLGDFRLEFEMIIWINEYVDFERDMSAKAYYAWLIHTILVSNNIDIPYPKTDIYIKESSLKP